METKKIKTMRNFAIIGFLGGLTEALESISEGLIYVSVYYHWNAMQKYEITKQQNTAVKDTKCPIP